MSTRAWFFYNASPGDEQESTNYQFAPFFPARSGLTGQLVRSIYGIYSPGEYGSSPAPFSLDTSLGTYIAEALTGAAAKPASPDKPYVYMEPNV